MFDMEIALIGTKFRAVFVFLALLTLAACSGTGQIAPQATMAVPEGMAQIVVYRPWVWVGAAQHQRIWHNNTRVASLHTNEMTVLAAAPGQHVFKADFWGATFGHAVGIINVEANKTYLLEVSGSSFRQSIIDGSALTGRFGEGPPPQGASKIRGGMEATAGREELRGYKYVPPLVTAPLQGMTVRRGW